MQPLFWGLIYLMFFLSGAAAPIYQVVWVRSLTLIFGGSHLAVTAVLSIFMAGLTIGGYSIGKYVDHVKEPPLRLGTNPKCSPGLGTGESNGLIFRE